MSVIHLPNRKRSAKTITVRLVADSLLRLIPPRVPSTQLTISGPVFYWLIQDVRSSIALTAADRDAAIDAMRVTAEKRVEGILGNSRRRHYGHAALLVALCVASAPAGRTREIATWAADVRQHYRRRHAFREELARAFEMLGLAPLG